MVFLKMHHCQQWTVGINKEIENYFQTILTTDINPD